MQVRSSKSGQKPLHRPHRLQYLTDFRPQPPLHAWLFVQIWSVSTGVVGGSAVARFLNNSVLPDLSGNGRTVFAEPPRNLPEGKIFVQTIFYFQSFFECCIMGHGKPSFSGREYPVARKGALLCGRNSASARVFKYSIIYLIVWRLNHNG